MKSPRWFVAAGTPALFICFAVAFLRAQDPVPPAAPRPQRPLRRRHSKSRRSRSTATPTIF